MLKISKIVLKIHQDVWMDKFRNLHNNNKCFAQNWFWDNFDWKKQSLWIGKFNKMNHLPIKNEQITNFLQKLVDDLNKNTDIRSQIYIKFYFSRNIKSGEPDINYLLICNTPQLPEEFTNSIINVVFEQYQLTESIINKEDNFKRLIDHYISWNNFYTYYDLMGELQF